MLYKRESGYGKAFFAYDASNDSSLPTQTDTGPV